MPGPPPTRRPRDRTNRRKEGDRSASPSPASRSPSSPPKEQSDSNSQNYGRGYRSSSRGGKRGYSRGGYGGNSQFSYYYPTVVLEEEHYNQALLQQIEYYFSVENLCRDMYLRSLMDKDGWVPLSTITNFNRVKAFQPENSRLLEVVKTSTILELQGDSQVRKKEDWKHWILPNSDKPKPQPSSSDSSSSTSAASTTTTATTTTTTPNGTANPEKKLTFGDIALMNANSAPSKQVKPVAQPQPPSKPKQSAPSQAPQAAVHEDKKAAKHEEKEEKESKKSEEEWTTVSNLKKKKNRNYSSSSSSTSNNSKKAEVHEEKAATSTVSNHVVASALPEPEEKLAEVQDPVPVGDFDETTIDQLVIVTEIFSKTPANVANPNALVAHFPTVIRASKTKKNTLEKFTTSVGWTLKDTKLNISEYETIGQHRYLKYREMSMEKRKKLGAGKVEDMNTLYKFWSYFLRTHFNTVMYEDFKTCAVEDAKKNSRFGLELLFQFFSFGLEIKYRDVLFNDFQELVLQDNQEGSPYGLEKFNSYLRYKKDNVTLDIKADLQKLLEKQKQEQKNSKKDSK